MRSGSEAVVGLPEAGDAEQVEDTVVAEDREILELGLGDEHPVERIAMLAGQPPGSLGMHDRDVQSGEPLAGGCPRDVGGHLERTGQLSKAGLRGDLPRRCRAQKDDVPLVGNVPACAGRQAIGRSPTSITSSRATGH